ncbi:MAG: hypothetical protein U0T02_03550 [Solirubrobacteraceae bacterium]
MSDTSEILGNLPRTRPQRRSDHRPRPVSDAAPDTEVAGAAHRMAREERGDAGGEPGPDPVDVLTTAVRAAGELAEIGLSVGTRALRGTLERLPRP